MYPVPIKTLKYLITFVHLVFFSDIFDLNQEDRDKKLIKSKLKDFGIFLVVIRKFNKSNSVLILYKETYMKDMKDILPSEKQL